MQHVNDIKLYVTKLILWNKGFQKILLAIFPRLRFKTLMVSSNLAFTSSLLISKDSHIFVSPKFLSLAKVLGWRQSNGQWQDLVCPVVPNDSHFHAMLSSGCFMDLVNTDFFVPPIHLYFLSKQGHASALKVTYVFKVFGAQSCLMVA